MKRKTRYNRPAGLAANVGLLAGFSLFAVGLWLLRPWLAVTIAGALIMLASILAGLGRNGPDR